MARSIKDTAEMIAQLPSAPSYVALFHAGKGDAKAILRLRQAQLIQPDHAPAINLISQAISQQAATSIDVFPSSTP
jgi:hypothetical protein